MSDVPAASAGVRWVFSGKSKSIPPARASILAALLEARGTFLARIADDGPTREGDVRAAIHQHLVGNGAELLARSNPDALVVRRVTGDQSVPWDQAAAAALRAAISGAPDADEAYARWSVALALQSAHFVAGTAQAAWVAERVWTLRSPLRTAIEEERLRASVERLLPA